MSCWQCVHCCKLVATWWGARNGRANFCSICRSASTRRSSMVSACMSAFVRRLLLLFWGFFMSTYSFRQIHLSDCLLHKEWLLSMQRVETPDGRAYGQSSELQLEPLLCRRSPSTSSFAYLWDVVAC